MNIHLIFPARQHNTNTCSSAQAASIILLPQPYDHRPSFPKPSGHFATLSHLIVYVRQGVHGTKETSWFSHLPVACFPINATFLPTDHKKTQSFDAAHAALSPVSVCSGNMLKQLIQKDYFRLHTYFRQPMRFGRKQFKDSNTIHGRHPTSSAHLSPGTISRIKDVSHTAPSKKLVHFHKLFSYLLSFKSPKP